VASNEARVSLPLEPKDYKSALKPIWCPGCGDFGVLHALTRALARIGRPPHEIALISGIGCSSRIPGYTTAYGFNAVHGRALPIAQGLKLARPELRVLVAGGDGDGFSIGGGHIPHAVRRNLDLTYLVMDNQVYGLTKGQVSPTSSRGTETPTSPSGSEERPVLPILQLLAHGAPFVAQGTSADLGELTDLVEEAIRYPGFAFLNVLSPCVTYGEDDHQVQAIRARSRSLASLGHDPSDADAAFRLARRTEAEVLTGVFHRAASPPPTLTEILERRRATHAAELAPSRADVLAGFAVSSREGR
jgi:2-oxoglutarate ferredoxin oxidoreductase subunit beta